MCHGRAAAEMPEVKSKYTAEERLDENSCFTEEGEEENRRGIFNLPWEMCLFFFPFSCKMQMEMGQLVVSLQFLVTGIYSYSQQEWRKANVCFPKCPYSLS